MKNVKLMCVLFFVFLFLVGSVSGITGSIGNARMILRAETGDVIEKYILVKNVNNVSVEIELSASGDLAEYIDVLDDSFLLEPKSEKKARFVVSVEEPGTMEGTIDVKFTPVDGKNGVGLMSTVVVIAEKGSWFDWGDEKEEEDEEDFDSGITGGAVGVSGDGNFVLVILVLMVLVLVVLVVIFLVVLRKGSSEKSVVIKKTINKTNRRTKK